MVGTTNAIGTGTGSVTTFKITNSLCTGTVSTTSAEGITLNRVGYIIGNANDALEVDGVYAPIEKCTEAIGYKALKSGSKNVVTIAEQSMWNAGAELLGFDLEGAWETRYGNTPELRAFATDDYDAGNCIIADTSWFNETDTTFTIENAADFYGLSLLVSAGNTFDGLTIEVADGVDEIDLNSSWTAGSGLPDIIWNPIGCNGNYFKGTFNGNGVTIKGIYAGGDDLTNIGLFGYVHENATLKNFYLKNSEFNQNSGTGASVGSIAAEMHGAVNTVYSEAVINSKCQYTGGLFARVNGGSTTLSTDPDTGIKECNRGIVSIQDAWYDGTMNVTYKAADVSKDDVEDTFRYVGGIFAVVIQGTVDMDNILFTGTIDTASYPSRAYAGGIAGATMAQAIANATTTYQDDDYTTIDLSSCISAGVVNQDGSQCSAIVGRLESGINTTKDGDVVIAAYPKDTYLKMDNVYATSECNDYVSRVTSTKPVTVTNSDSTTTEVSSTGIIVGSTVVQSQYNSDQLIGYCNEYDYGDTGYALVSELDFAAETGWTMRTAGVPIPKQLSAAVEEGTLVIDTSALTSELGLTYWTNSTKTLADAINSGKGNYILNYTEGGDLTYEGFLTYLENNTSFTGYVVNRADSKLTPMANDGVYNSTYINGNWVMNITYVAKKGTVDVVINTFGEEVLSPNLQAENVTITENGLDVKFSMLKLADAGVMGEYGNAFVFQLPNGHFIVSDGGKSADAEGLITYLRELAAGDDIEDNNVYIDAWVLSHFHSDHCGALIQLYNSGAASLRKDVYVKAIYVNEPNNYAKLFELNQYDNAYKALAGAMKFTQGPDSTEKPKVYRMHTGERYYFDGVTMDVVLTQEQLDPHYNAGIDSAKQAYRYYGDWDGFNATSTTCVFTVTDTQDKIYIGGDANKANMNYIMQAYDGETNRLVHVKETGYDSSNSYRYYERYTEQVRDAENNKVAVSNITPTASQTLSDITVFVALHHGKNTSGGFTQYLFGGEEKLEYVLFPYHQMYEATFHYSKTGDDGVTYTNRYWMEDDSTVFDYRIKEINETLYGYADNKYYTYGYEDCTGATSDNPHGTVELTFTLNGITPNELE